jgi:hypothetical protein
VPELCRAYTLLKVLTILPYGESLQNLTRFDPKFPFFLGHALELDRRGLIEVITSNIHLGSDKLQADPHKLLAVSRSVRDHVLTQIPDDEIKDLTEKATQLYFGADWASGKVARARDSGSLEVDLLASGLNNRHAVIRRLLAEAAKSEADNTKSTAFALARAYCVQLGSKQNYRACEMAAKNFLSLAPDAVNEMDKLIIKFHLGRSLRMLKRNEEARPILLDLKDKPFDRKTKARVLLNLALCLRSLDDPDSLAVAKEIVAADKKSKLTAALHAKSIIVQAGEKEGRIKKLKAIESSARKQKMQIVANNVALFRVENHPLGYTQDTRVLEQVYATARADVDHHTAARASLELGRLDEAENVPINKKHLRGALDAYHYLYAERSSDMFDSAHSLLWNHFEKEGDVDNLLKLFRHSSFIWRLYEADEREKSYIKRLEKIASKLLTQDVRTANQETAYFVIRAKRVSTETSR